MTHNDDLRDEVPSGPYQPMVPPDDLAAMWKFLRVMGTDVTIIKERVSVLPDHEDRIRSLEKWKNAIPAAVVLAIVAAIVGAK